MSSSDHRVIVGQTGQNVLGLGIGAVATFAAQVLMTRALGDEAFGVVTLDHAGRVHRRGAATRFGMDVANVRLVAILAGRGEVVARARARPTLGRDRGRRVGAVRVGGVPARRGGSRSGSPRSPTLAEPAFRAAAVTVPFAALAFVYMGATRGLKIMRYTLYSQWIVQPIGWIVLTIAFWTVVEDGGR